MTSLFSRMRPLAAEVDTPDRGEGVIVASLAENPGTSWRSIELEAEIAAALAENPLPGERLAAAFQRKEQTLAALFARLTIADARELHRRFSRPATDDLVTASFQRLISERRARLLAFLADARRRNAIQAARGLGARRV